MAAKGKAVGLWIGVALVFGLCLAAWAAMITAAHHHPVREIKIEKAAS